MRCLTFVYVFLTFLLLCSESVRKTEELKEVPFGPPVESTAPHEVIPTGLQKLLKAYPDFLVSADINTLVWKDGTRMPFDDGIKDKDFETLLNSPDLQDQLQMVYPKGRRYYIPEKNSDPGRIRYEPFFLKMYGSSPEAVRKNLVPISWLPGTVNQTLLITSINGVNEKLQAISEELDALKHLRRYLDNPAGTFHWRRVNGTVRLSPHSFGIAIDVNVKYANCWEWDDPKKELIYPGYANRIPLEIVEIFEKHGFIWGGKWYHYDTMHFEYRPELLMDDLQNRMIWNDTVASSSRIPPSGKCPAASI